MRTRREAEQGDDDHEARREDILRELFRPSSRGGDDAAILPPSLSVCGAPSLVDGLVTAIDVPLFQLPPPPQRDDGTSAVEEVLEVHIFERVLRGSVRGQQRLLTLTLREMRVIVAGDASTAWSVRYPTKDDVKGKEAGAAFAFTGLPEESRASHHLLERALEDSQGSNGRCVPT